MVPDEHDRSAVAGAGPRVDRRERLHAVGDVDLGDERGLEAAARELGGSRAAPFRAAGSRREPAQRAGSAGGEVPARGGRDARDDRCGPGHTCRVERAKRETQLASHRLRQGLGGVRPLARQPVVGPRPGGRSGSSRCPRRSSGPGSTWPWRGRRAHGGRPWRAGSYQTTPSGNCCEARMKSSVSSQPAGSEAVRPSECRNPPTSSTTSRRTDMLAPMRLRTGPASSRWPGVGAADDPVELLGQPRRPGVVPAGDDTSADAEHERVGVGREEAPDPVRRRGRVVVEERDDRARSTPRCPCCGRPRGPWAPCSRPRERPSNASVARARAARRCGR